jgi:predicted porin
MKKSSALALAIAGTLAAPMAMAEGVYVSARLGVDSVSHDDAAEEGLTIGDLSTRLGWKGETDLGNGLTAFGKLEVTSEFGTRHLYVGLMGDFGKMTVAHQGYTAYYNHVSAPVDQPYWVGGSGIIYNSRTNNFIDYAGGNDMFSFGIAVEANGTDTTDANGVNTSTSGYQAGASFGLGEDWTIGLGVRNAEDSAVQGTNGTVSGITVSGNLSDIYLAASFQQDDDDTGTQIHAAFGSFFVNYGSLDDDSTGRTPTTIAVGYSQSIGENTSFWAEAQSKDSDGGDDSTEVVAALRYDWN